MKRSDLEFLIDSFLHKFEEKSNDWGMFEGLHIMKKCLGLFLRWCIEENLLDSES